MNDVIFVTTEHQYDSYRDFWNLVIRSDFPIVSTSDVDIEQNVTYILSPHNGEWKPVIDAQRNKTKRARLIDWNLERPSGSGGLENYIRDNQQLVDEGYFDEIWVSDRELARRCNFSYVILGGVKNFSLMSKYYPQKLYDYIHISYNSPRRSFLFDEPGICKKKINGMKIAPNAWGTARHTFLLQSRMMLNIHQDNFQFIEPIRFLLAALYELPIVTEFCLDPYPYEVIDIGMYGSGMKHVTFLDRMEDVLDDYNTSEIIAIKQENYKLMTEEYTFRSAVEAVL